jgi:hypothetical protein
VGLFIYSLYEKELTAVSTLREKGIFILYFIPGLKGGKPVTVFTPEF